MQRCINVPFDFRGKEYFAIVRKQIISNKINYKIRIMNHRLDSLLHKSNLNIIEEGDSNMLLAQEGKMAEQTELRLSILRALTNQIAGQGHTSFDFITDFKLLTPF
jgi:cell division GTPase FtsZ